MNARLELVTMSTYRSLCYSSIESKFAKDVEFRVGIVVENDYVVLEEEDRRLVRNFDRFDEVSNVAMWLRPWNYL